jgi:hypothetical protein
MVKKIFDYDYILSSSSEATIFNEVTKNIIERETFDTNDNMNNKNNEDWSILANQVVGFEKLDK